MERKNSSVIAKVVNYVRENIEDGSWPLDTKIPSENELCRTLGVSRSSVRTALSRFVVLGILESRQGHGTTVRSVDTSAVGKGYVEGGRTTPVGQVFQWGQARFTVEPMIAYQVAKIATPQMVTQLEEINRLMIESVGNPARFIHYDMLFHKTLVDMLDNKLLSDFLYPLLDENAEVHLQNNESFGYYGGVHYHTLIIDAIKSHSPSRALNLTLEHGYVNISELEFEDEVAVNEDPGNFIQ